MVYSARVMSRAQERGVQLPPQTTASGLFHALLTGARGHFESLREVEVPDDPKAFRSTFASVLPRFEAARVASKDRSAIARRVTLEAAGALVYRDASGAERPLAEFLSESGAEPFTLTTLTGKATRDLALEIPFEDQTASGAQAAALIDQLEAEHAMTPAAAEALRWTLLHAADGLDLSGRKFVLLGAGAELAPTPLLLAAGADVLWIDVAAPKLDPASFRGTLRFVEGGADILTDPSRIVATIEAFAGEDTVTIGMFAYAAGQGREWRLEAAMNAITRALPRGRVAGVGIYISPTSAARVVPQDAAETLRRRQDAPAWQKLLGRARGLGPGLAEHGDVRVSRAIVPLQGASYQAAQYVAKALVAEAFATSRRFGVVSANVAGITNTGSMGVSVFQAGFVGAKLFGVRIFEPSTTRVLSGLLLLHDWLHTDANLADPPARLFERQIHGGVYCMPWALDDAIRVAALYGFARKPSLITRALRGR
jgi:hypothetical protein